MYYNRILRVWMLDSVDVFLFSAILGGILASSLKEYLSEEKAGERLKNSIIKKSKAVVRPTANSRKMSVKKSIKKIYKFVLGNRGGDFQADSELSNEGFQMAQKIKEFVERLAIFLKERELKGVARIFFKNGRLILELILYTCRIKVNYAFLAEGLSTQTIVITATTGGAAGFTLSWFSAGASLVAPPVLISILSIRSIAQQILNQRDYLKFKNLMEKLLKDEKIKESLRAIFIEGEIPTPRNPGIEMPAWDSDKNFLPEFNFDSVDPDQTFEEFLKDRMKDELGLVENPTSEQIQEMIENRKIRNKGKTVYFKDFIKEDPNDIIDAEIINEAIEEIKLKVKNEEL